MLLVLDPSTAAVELAAGNLDCRENGCVGVLGPWGYARTRWLRLGPGRTEAHTPRRARCRTCRRTHVLLPARSYPRRPDTVETVGSALLAAVEGLGYRRIAERIEVPATTVRGWLQRARANSETIRVNATIATCALDPMATKFDPTDTPLGDMVGRRRPRRRRVHLPPRSQAPPWQLALDIARAGILHPCSRQITRFRET